MNITEILSPENIFLDINETDIEKIAESVLKKLQSDPAVKSYSEAKDALLERERKGSTAIGYGVAVPHARTDAVRDILLAFIRAQSPIAVETPDGQPCFFLFMALVPKEKADDYLALLGQISRIMKRDSVREKLLVAPNPDAVYDLFKSIETGEG